MSYKVFVEPTGIHSRAMVRIARALTAHAPKNVRITLLREKADIVVLYVIGPDCFNSAHTLFKNGQRYAVVQCCLDTAGVVDRALWSDFWSHAAAVWSYYDLALWLGDPSLNFQLSPLGLDMAFRDSAPIVGYSRPYTAITTGYVHGPGAEAIEEVWRALTAVKGTGVHIGPRLVQGMSPPRGWQNADGLTDRALSLLYSRARYVCALRHVEGFELPAAEGLACGARPVVFDQPAMRRWYSDWPIYIPECSGNDLTRALIDVFAGKYRVVTDSERTAARARFNWEPVAREFWSRLLFTHTTHTTHPTNTTQEIAV